MQSYLGLTAAAIRGRCEEAPCGASHGELDRQPSSARLRTGASGARPQAVLTLVEPNPAAQSRRISPVVQQDSQVFG